MGMAALHQDRLSLSEDIRLVIWDLDETFWRGTLTEGGIRYRMENHDLVIRLARRGIMSAICSKNDPVEVETVLRDRGLWDCFIFPSVDWTPKGPRIAAMLRQIGLRANSVLFLDDNPMNLAQAAHMCPGLNTATPEVIGSLCEMSQFRGKPDPQLTRLAQYKLNERKASAVKELPGDAVAFLRTSNVRAYIEHDVEAHLDRAIELINRTNQLNFTKSRLPEDMDAARTELRALLAHNTTDAALIRVKDDFGDYGFVGFYLTRRMHNVRRLVHFCFSCRTLNMFVEHWAYAFFGRPELNVVGEVLTDPKDTSVQVDWITPAPIEDVEQPAASPMLTYDRIFARGGCDLASLMHYFGMHGTEVVEEFNAPRNGQMLRRDHTAFLMPALGETLTDAQIRAAARLGYGESDFDSELLESAGGRELYLFSFWADADVPVYRSRDTDLRVPYWLVGAQHHNLIAKHELREAVAETDAQRARLKTLCTEYEHEGLLSDAEMQARYAHILSMVPNEADVVIVLANERGPRHFQNAALPNHPHHARQNAVLRVLAKDFENVTLMDPADYIHTADDLIDLNHFKRPIYHRIYRDAILALSERHAGRADG